MNSTQVVVIGAGHAGCEAALASARCGAETVLLTLNLDTIAHMPCNPSIGGQGKGQLVREIDALGGEMGIVADDTNIQSRLLNTRKGLAVQSIRVQSDKYFYGSRMRESTMKCPRLAVIQGHATEICVENNRVTGVRTMSGDYIRADVVILTPGTFLRGKIHLGTTSFSAGRAGEPPADALGESIQNIGLPVMRFKTGTPPRVEKKSIDFSGLEIQADDPATPPFSLRSPNRGKLKREPCFLTHTSAATHQIIRDHLHESALFSGKIQGIGPRYCPSIEDKIRKFPHKETHKVFLEPESVDSFEIYLQGLSTSLPEQVQELYVRSLPGLENSRITRPGYAIEYDIVDPTSLYPTLASKKIAGLFLAGQVNGTSGYEEAAGQGILAGMNAAATIAGKSLLILKPELSYIGLMIEEITTSGLIEPYRIFTSRSQHRLHLRMSNAEDRLAAIGHSMGLIVSAAFQKIQTRTSQIQNIIKKMSEYTISEKSLFTEGDLPGSSATANKQVSFAQLLRRPEITLERIFPLFSDALKSSSSPDHDLLIDNEKIDPLGKIEIEAQIKYEGYLAQQDREIKMVKEFHDLPISDEFLSNLPESLSTEARQRILSVKPRSLGSLSNIPGIRATDVILVLMHLRRNISANVALPTDSRGNSPHPGDKTE